MKNKNCDGKFEKKQTSNKGNKKESKDISIRLCGKEFNCQVQEIQKKEDAYLDKDIKEIIIETDEKDPKFIARINEILSPSEGYRVRVKFKDNDFNNRLKTLESKVNLLESKVSKSTL